MSVASPLMVTLVREAKGWTQKEFSEHLDMTQGLVSKVENGLISLSSERLERFADILECPVDLLTDESAVRGLEVTCLHHRRKGSMMPVGVKKKIEALTHLARISIEGLLDGVDIETDAELVRMPVEAFDDGPAEVAQTLRARWRVPTGPIPNLMRLIESVGIIAVVRPLGTHAQDAVSTWPHEQGRPALMLINSGLAADRQRFTVAHELGHLIMHVMPGADQEKEANTFAAEFLAPAEEIGPELASLQVRDIPRLLDLKARWGMSVAALVQRAKDLGCINDAQFRTFRVTLSRLGWTSQEPGNLPQEYPSVIDRALTLQKTERHRTVDELAKLAKMTPAALCHYYPAVSDEMIARTTLRLVQ